MSGKIAALSVDKVQTFLTEVIHSHVQEKEKEDATLQGIVNASYQISKGFYESVQNTFPESGKDFLLECSGVYIFRTDLPSDELEGRLNGLFQEYYLKSQGQKLIRWVYFDADGLDNIGAIKEAKKRLKRTGPWNHILEKNRELLFSFQPVPKDSHDHCERPPYFAENLNALCTEPQDEEKKNRFRIAVIKADLDGMGAMFEAITDYEVYSKISQILRDDISMEGLQRAAEQYTHKGLDKWMFPFYIAGDDVFFAVAVKDLFRGINTCRALVKSINKKISSAGIQNQLSISIGVDITWNRQPIRYYMEMVEAQLKNAKRTETPALMNSFFNMKISMGGLTFFDIDEQKLKEKKRELEYENKKKKESGSCQDKKSNYRAELSCLMKNIPVWNYFLHDLKILKYIRENGRMTDGQIGSPTFFYTLLTDISDMTVREDNMKYINHILYHLFPKHMYDSDQSVKKAELMLHSRLIQQLCRNNGKGPKITLDEWTKKRFEAYLRLMIFFCDVRFDIAVSKDGDTEKKEVGQYLCNVPREYLYDCLYEKSSKLTEVFVKRVPEDFGQTRKAGFRQIQIDKSMFFRLRNTDKIPIDKAAEMIELKNPLTDQEIKKLNENREKAQKLPRKLFFNKEDFVKAAEDKAAWNPDFVDAMMLFYQYNELSLEYKRKDAKGRK